MHPKLGLWRAKPNLAAPSLSGVGFWKLVRGGAEWREVPGLPTWGSVGCGASLLSTEVLPCAAVCMSL